MTGVEREGGAVASLWFDGDGDGRPDQAAADDVWGDVRDDGSCAKQKVQNT